MLRKERLFKNGLKLEKVCQRNADKIFKNQTQQNKKIKIEN